MNDKIKSHHVERKAGITETLIAMAIQSKSLGYSSYCKMLAKRVLFSRSRVFPEDCVYDRNPVVESLHISIHTVGQELDQTMNRPLVVL